MECFTKICDMESAQFSSKMVIIMKENGFMIRFKVMGNILQFLAKFIKDFLIKTIKERKRSVNEISTLKYNLG